MTHENVGHIATLADGHYRVRVFLGRDPVTGKQLFDSRSVRGTIAEARRVRREMVAARQFAATRDYTLKDLANEWVLRVLKKSRLRSGRVRQITCDEYEAVLGKMLKLAPLYENRPLRTFDPKAIRGLYDSIGETPGGAAGYLRYLHGILRQMFRWAVEAELIQRDPTAHIERPEPEKRRPHRALEMEEQARLIPELRAFEHTGGLMLELALWLGLRPSEAIGIRIDAIDWEERVLEIKQRIRRSRRKGCRVDVAPPKTETSIRKLRIPETFMPRLEAQRLWVRKCRFQSRTRSDKWDVYGLLFPARGGVPYDSGNIQRRVLDKAAERAGIGKITLHGLRHSAATRMAEEGHTIPEIVAQLGHFDLKMLRIYIHKRSRPPANIANAIDEQMRALEAQLAVPRPARVVQLGGAR